MKFSKEDLAGKEIKEGLVDEYLYKDGKKFICQVCKSKESQYLKVINYHRRTKEEYISMHNSKLKNANKNISLKYNIPTNEFLLEDDYNPLGKNLERHYEETFINKLELNCVNSHKYLILKIASDIYIDKNKSAKFLCEDNNGDIITTSMNHVDRYFNPKNLDFLQKEILKLGKYIIVIEPNYGMFEVEVLDEIKINSPSEVIFLEDKKELDDFLNKHNNPTSENYKLLGNLMIKNHFYEKAIFYYQEGIKLNKTDTKLEIILYSNLSEAYIKYGYYTKAIINADCCLNKINIIMKDKTKEKDIFLHQLKIRVLFRKLKALITLRKFKEAYDLLFDKSDLNSNKDIMNDFLKLQQVKDYISIVQKGYENTLGHYNYIEMLQEEKINFEMEKFGEYLNPKIEIKYQKEKGIKMLAKEKINIGELLTVEKALVCSQNEDYEKKEDKIVSADNPKVIVEIEMFNKLYLKLKKSPLDYEKFYYLCDGRNLNQDLNERKKYAEEQDKGLRNIEMFKINQTICLNKYGIGRHVLINLDYGSGVWGYASFFNHDCLPNSTSFNIGDYHIGYCIREIEKGEEITAKYVSSSKSYKKRQQILLENWRFNCNCQLCTYQQKRKNDIYDKYMEMMDKSTSEINKKDAKLFEEYLEQNKKQFSCYEMANAYLKLEEYFHIIRDFNEVQKLSNLVTKYADGKNYTFQLNNLYLLMLSICLSGKNNFFKVYKEVIKYLEKYTPLKSEEIDYFIRKAMDKI